MSLRFALLFCLCAVRPVWADCIPGRVEINGAFGKALFSVEIADDDAERAQGLMHRESLPRGAGMLFVYDAPRRVSFWMRNTLIELDMIFVDETGVIHAIHHRAKPLDDTAIPGGATPSRVVLEINGGLAHALGIKPGDKLRHPVFGC